MRKAIAAAAIVAAAAGTVLFGSGHADATQICGSISINGGTPVPQLPVALPVALPLPIEQGACIPPDGVLPALPPLPVPVP